MTGPQTPRGPQTVDVDVYGLPLILKPFRPVQPGWARVPVAWQQPPGGPRFAPYAIEKYYNRGQELQVITAIEVVLPDSEIVLEGRPEYHVSVSGLKWMADRIYRVSDSRARWAMKQFGYADFTEDNHVPDGLVRNFWRPIDQRYVGEICKCVEREPAIRTMKGDYVWRG